MINKQRCVVIIGAGASVPFHVPVHDQLLDLLNPAAPYTRHLEKATKYLYEENQSFRRDLKEIQERLTQPWKKKPNLETVLTVIRVLESVDIPKIKILETFDLPHFGGVIELINLFLYYRKNTYNSDKNLNQSIMEFKKYLYIFLKRVVYDDKRTFDSKTGIPNPWHSFFDYCNKFKNTTWCSFNWDCILENSFYHHMGKTSMNLPNSKIPPNGGSNNEISNKHTLLKLHGGINLWHEDGQGEIISLLPLPTAKQHSNWDGFIDNRWGLYERNKKINGYPIILEPSAFKYEDPIYKQIKPHWKMFTDEMRNAHLIIIIGYSYPKTDSQMQKSPLKDALENANKCASIVIIDPDHTGEVRARYEDVFKDHYDSKNLHFIQEKYNEVKIEENLNKLLQK